MIGHSEAAGQKAAILTINFVRPGGNTHYTLFNIMKKPIFLSNFSQKCRNKNFRFNPNSNITMHMLFLSTQNVIFCKINDNACTMDAVSLSNSRKQRVFQNHNNLCKNGPILQKIEKCIFASVANS
jgi:hypothetical protein